MPALPASIPTDFGMRLSPLDIKKQEFSRKLRGIDDDEVRAFLDQVASQWEDMQDEHRRMEDRVRELEGKLEHYEKVEEALQEALQTARDSSEERLRNAQQKADNITQEAKAKADRLLQDAREQRQQFRRDIQALASRRDDLVVRLRGFLTSELEVLARFEGQDPRGYIESLASGEEVDPERFDVEKEARASASLDEPERKAAPKAAPDGGDESAEDASTEETAGEPAAPPEESAAQEPPAPPAKEEEDDELAKIRRILNDLD